MTASAISRPRTAATPDAGHRASSRNAARAARIAGIGYVLIFALALFANFFVREQLVVADDAAATVDKISASPGLFRLGLIAFLAVFVIDIVVAWALHAVFRDANRDLSLVSAWSRLVYTVFLGVALVFFFQVLQLTGDSAHVAALGPDQLATQVMIAIDSFDAMWLIGLTAFGLHLTLVGALVLQSGYAPRALGFLLIAAGIAYAADTIAHGLLSNYSEFETLFLTLVVAPSVIGEGWLGLWLLRTRRFDA